MLLKETITGPKSCSSSVSGLVVCQVFQVSLSNTHLVHEASTTGQQYQSRLCIERVVLGFSAAMQLLCHGDDVSLISDCN